LAEQLLGADEQLRGGHFERVSDLRMLASKTLRSTSP
jgi:hypothetical protein